MSGVRARATAAGALAAALFATCPAGADVDPPVDARRDLDRPHTLLEAEAGIVALPGSPVSPTRRGGQTPFGSIGAGDATVQLGAHLLYRWGPWVVGAGARFAPSGTSDDVYGGRGGEQRSHARSYFQIGPEMRWVPLRLRSFEGWVGASGGVVVISDRFTTDAPPVPAILGEQAVTVSTEGLTLGLGVGAVWHFLERWSLGLNARGSQWFLPSRPQCTVLGDCATLQGSATALEVGLAVGYLVPL